MKTKLYLTAILSLFANTLFAQLNKQQTLDYIFNVYRETYHHYYNSKPIEISVHYQTLIIKYDNNYTLSASLKDTLAIFKMKDINDGSTYWSIGRHNENVLPGISTEDACKRLYRALLHLQLLLKDDKENKDPFDN